MEELKEKTYQRLKKELLSELNIRIFDNRIESNKGLINKIVDDLFEEARKKLKKEVQKEIKKIFTEDFEDKIWCKTCEVIKKGVSKQVGEEIESCKELIHKRVEGSSRWFIQNNMPSYVREEFNRKKENMVKEIIKEEVKKQAISYLGRDEISMAEIQKDYKIAAEIVKNEILEELREDLRSIKIGGKIK